MKLVLHFSFVLFALFFQVHSTVESGFEFDLKDFSDLLVYLQLNLRLAESLEGYGFQYDLHDLRVEMEYMRTKLHEHQILMKFCGNSKDKLLNMYQRDLVNPWAKKINHSWFALNDSDSSVSKVEAMARMVKSSNSKNEYQNQGTRMFKFDYSTHKFAITNSIIKLTWKEVQERVFDIAEKQTGSKVSNIKDFYRVFTISEDINLKFTKFQDAVDVYITLPRLKIKLR